MAFNKVGFHIAANCAGCTGISDYWEALDAAGVPFTVYSADEAGLITEAARYTHATLIYRDTQASTVNPADYDRDPETMAAVYWQRTLDRLPAAIKALKARVWVELLNEPGREDAQADWVGELMYQMANLALGEGYRVMGAGWATGCPEPTAWTSDGWGSYLRLCAIYPDRVAVSLHEYSLNNDIHNQEPWLIGRFQQLFDACDEMGIARPKVWITECGWTLNSMPPDAQAKQDIAYLAGLYAAHPEIQAAQLWTLQAGAGNGNLPQRLNALMPWLTQYSIEARFPDPVETPPKPPTPPQTGTYKAVVVKAPQDVSSAEWDDVAAYCYPYRHDMTASHDSMLALLRAGNPQSFVKLAYPKRQADVAKMITAAGYSWVPIFEQPDTEPFKFVVYPVDGVRAVNQAFGSRPEVYAQYGFPGHEGIDLRATLNAPVRAVADGVVDSITDTGSNGYGKAVHIKHAHDWRTSYGHLASYADGLKVGDAVKAGDMIGLAGSTGNSTGPHLHLTLKRIGSTYTDARGVVWPFSIFDPTPYIKPFLSTPPDYVTIDLLPYLRGDGRLYEVQHPTGATETFQGQTDGDYFYTVKNSQWEQFYADADYIWRGYDTSPGNGRYYLQYEPGLKRARWCLRRMRAGQAWVGSGHRVQFYDKATCKESAPNSGAATNRMSLVARHASKTWNGITVPDVVELTNGTETYWYGRGYGLVAWSSPWGQSAIVQVYAAGERPRLIRESIKCIGS